MRRDHIVRQSAPRYAWRRQESSYAFVRNLLIDRRSAFPGIYREVAEHFAVTAFVGLRELQPDGWDVCLMRAAETKADDGRH